MIKFIQEIRNRFPEVKLAPTFKSNYILLFFLILRIGEINGQTYNQITTIGGLVDGDYLIIGDGTTNDGIMLNTVDATPFINRTTITNPGSSITSGFTSANVFQITVISGDITIYNSTVGYVSWGRTGNTGNTANFFNGTIANSERWTPTVSGGLWTLTNVGTTARSLQWNNSSPRFACYTSAQVRLKLYRLASTAPLAPTMGTITPGNQQLSVAFTAGSDGGSAITSYKYSTDGGATFLTRQTGTTASPIVITTLSSDGTTPLTNGASYNVQIRAVNAIGDGTATSSTSATPFTTPSAPTINSITAGNTQLSVAFTAGNDGGSTISNYQYSTDGGATFLTRQTGTTASPILITTLSSDGSTPLTNGVSYDVQIKAVNAAGAGAASSTTSGTPLAPVTPTITSNGTLAAVNTIYGSASSTTSFILSGATLTAGITVTPPVGFEVSTTSDFSSNIGNNSSPLVVGSAPTVSSTTIYVRLQATANVSGSPYSGNIVLSSSGASNVNVPTVTSSVSARELTISGLSASSKTYDGNSNVIVTGSPVFSGLQNGDLATVTGSPTFAFANANAGLTKSINQTGSYGASFTSGVIDNYTITQPTLTADINTVAITVTASAQSKNFGEVSTTTGSTSFTITSGTLVGTDNISTVTLAYSGSPSGDLASATAGTYTITPSAAAFSVGTSSNYNITYNTGTLTINAIAASAPTSIVITPSNIQLSVAFTAASNGGSPITSYKYSTDGGLTFLTRQTGTTASPIVISTLSSDGTTPLTNGVSYPIQIRAVTGFGDGTATTSTNATPNIVNSSVTAWINTGNTTAWHTSSNWSPATVPSGSVVAQWNNTGSATGCGINLGTGIPSILALEVGNSRTRSLLLGGSAGSGSMTLNGGVINNISDVIIRNSSNSLFTIASSNGGGTLGITIANTTNNKISIDNTGGIAISLVIAGGSSNPLTKIGTGSGVLSLTGANTYTGLTTVTEGTLQLNRSGGTTIPNTNNVVINGGTLQISSNQTLNDLTLTSGTLIIDAGVTLTVNGTITRTSGVIRGSATSNLVITGASGNIAFDQTTPGTTNVLRNLTISGSGTTTLANALNIAGGSTPGVLTVGSGATLNTGDNLILKSDASGTASIGNSSGTISGNVTVERFIPRRRAFRFLASPVNTSTFISGSWQQATHITGSLTGSNGFDQSNSGTASLFTYNVSGTEGWAAIPNTNATNLNIGTGYRMLVRGDRNINLNTVAQDSAALVLSATGSIVTGNVVFGAGSVSSSPAGIPSLNAIAGSGANNSTIGWSLIGNPYACAVNWANITKSNVSTTFATWNVNNAGRGSYVYHDGSTGTGTGASNIINSGQSIFVQTIASNPSITFTEASKVNTTPPSHFKKSVSDVLNVDIFIGDRAYDGLTVVFDANCSNEYDVQDFIKLVNPEINFYSYLADGTRLAMNKMKEIGSETIIPLGLNGVFNGGSYELKFSNQNTFINADVYLKDKFINKTYDLKSINNLTFTVTADSNSFGENRFELIFSKSATGLNNELSSNNNNFIVFPNPANNVLNLSLTTSKEDNYSYSIFNQLGAEVSNGNLDFNNKRTHALNIESLSNGVYFIQVKNGKTAQTIKFIK